ncbi:hypothetical protein ACTU3I_13610 [Microbacterium sp. RD1]|uniref:hypothetical protein n=1 Tax=Microbacterium sp. RD1 TaxID=3457313 RepID=UPI003FA5B69B
MTGVSDLLASIAASLLAVAGLIAVRARLRRDRGLRGELVTYFGGATLAAIVCAVMNMLEVVGGGSVPAAVGNATNVLAPALLWTGARRLNGRAVVGTVTASASALLMCAVTFVVPLDGATLLKTGGIVVFSALTALEVRRAALGGMPGTRVIAAAMWSFAAFNAARILVAATAGMHSDVWNTFVSAEITSIVSAAVILLVGFGAVRLGRHLLDDPEPGTRAHAREQFRVAADALLTAHPSVVGLRVRIPELDLIRVAHGAQRADATVAALVEAARSGLPGAVTGLLSRDTVGAILPDADDDVAGAVRARFARAVTTAGIDDVPELRIYRTGIAEAGQLEAFFDSRPARR